MDFKDAMILYASANVGRDVYNNMDTTMAKNAARNYTYNTSSQPEFYKETAEERQKRRERRKKEKENEKRYNLAVETYNTSKIPAILEELRKYVETDNVNEVSNAVTMYHNTHYTTFNKNDIPPETNGIKDAIILSAKDGKESLLITAINKQNRDIINLLLQSFDNEPPIFRRSYYRYAKSYNELIVPAILHMLHQAINSSNSNAAVKQLIDDYNNAKNTSFKNGIPPLYEWNKRRYKIICNTEKLFINYINKTK
jgi:hypothetical protein